MTVCSYGSSGSTQGTCDSNHKTFLKQFSLQTSGKPGAPNALFQRQLVQGLLGLNLHAENLQLFKLTKTTDTEIDNEFSFLNFYFAPWMHA